MNRNKILSAIATAALVTAGSSVAKPATSGHPHGASAKAKAKGNAKAKTAKQARADKATGASAKAKGRLNSQGPANASPRALERASANSVLAGGTVVSGPLAGLTAGTPIHHEGQMLGTVERIVPSNGRKVGNVLVRLSSGRIVPLAPASLDYDGSTWTATTLKPSANR